jgi:hypothetical protein
LDEFGSQFAATMAKAAGINQHGCVKQQWHQLRARVFILATILATAFATAGGLVLGAVCAPNCRLRLLAQDGPRSSTPGPCSAGTEATDDGLFVAGRFRQKSAAPALADERVDVP